MRGEGPGTAALQDEFSSQELIHKCVQHSGTREIHEPPRPRAPAPCLPGISPIKGGPCGRDLCGLLCLKSGYLTPI